MFRATTKIELIYEKRKINKSYSKKYDKMTENAEEE